MNSLIDKLHAIGSEVLDVDQEVFESFAITHNASSDGLGYISLDDSLEISAGGSDFTIKQSPTRLKSERAGGTTGAVVWKIAPLFAAWLASDASPVLREALLDRTSTVLELGAGISPVAALLLGRKVARYIASDQGYVLRLLRENIQENTPKPRHSARQPGGYVEVVSLDWETDDAPSLLQRLNANVNAVVVSDCVFNEYLIEPLVSTCAAVCGSTRESARSGDEPVAVPPICIVAQQLRDPEVFEAWLSRMLDSFRVWRVHEGLGEGFVVHIAAPRFREN